MGKWLLAQASSLYENIELNFTNQVRNLIAPYYPKSHSPMQEGRNPPANSYYAFLTSDSKLIVGNTSAL